MRAKVLDDPLSRKLCSVPLGLVLCNTCTFSSMNVIHIGADCAGGVSISTILHLNDSFVATVRVKSQALTIGDEDDTGRIVLDYREEYDVVGEEINQGGFKNAEDAINHILKWNGYKLLDSHRHSIYLQLDQNRGQISTGLCFAVFHRPRDTASLKDQFIGNKWTKTAIITITRWSRRMVDPQMFYVLSGLGVADDLGKEINNGIKLLEYDSSYLSRFSFTDRTGDQSELDLMQEMLNCNNRKLPLGFYSFEREVLEIKTVFYMIARDCFPDMP